MQFTPGKWYVMDSMRETLPAALVAGPFDSRALAEAERVQVNIADDCVLARVSDDGKSLCADD